MTALPSITVQCPAVGRCLAAGRQQRVVLRQVVPGFLDVPQLQCMTCGRVPEIVHGWPHGSTPEEGDMAKVTVHGGPSNAAADDEQSAAAEPAAAEEVESSPGTSSSTSSGKARKKPGPKPGSRQRRAPTTESPSEKDQTAASIARGTGGGQTEPTSETSSDST
jgi:hypothetical protein